ncbi:MAG TPA: MFS transporter [Candidatus Acidoferrales bacterium]|nr:MFS transporter [Candidatus Acidoferrales bacterium]
MKSAGATSWQLVAYSLPIIAIEFVIYPVLAILPAFYIHLSGGGLAAYATALVASRLVYSCSGPLVGYLSDRIETPWGRRIPWIVAGLAVEIVSVALLFTPPGDAGSLYFAWTSALVLFGFSMIDVPYIAWGSEITRDYQMRSRITSYRAVFAIIGQLVFLLLPFLPAFGGHSFLQRVVVAHLGVAAIVLLVVTIALALLFTPRTSEAMSAQPTRTPALRVLLHMARNRPMWYLTGATIFTFLPYVIQTTLALPLLASLGLASDFSPITIAGMVSAIATMPLWVWVTKRIGKHRTWTLGLVIMMLAPAVFFVVAHFFGVLAGMYASTIVGVFPLAQISASLPYAIMGDVIDYDELRTRANHSATYSAIILLVIRLQVAIGGSIALYILAALRFDARAVNPAVIQPAMLAGFFFVPVVLLAAAVLFIAPFPIDARRAEVVRKRLVTRERS